MNSPGRATPLNRSLSSSDTMDISQIVAKVREGSIRVPHFQRQLKWGVEDVRALFDSIYRGFPIGTLLLWQHQAFAESVNFGPLTLDAPENQNALWVVDGQQRITSLVASLSPRESPWMDPRFNVYFSLRDEKFIGSYRNARPHRSVPVEVALDSRSLNPWVREHDDELEADDDMIADQLNSALRGYRIPVYIMRTDDESLLRQVFDRINSAGKPITRAETFHALFASDTEPGSLRGVIEQLRRLGFGDIDENWALQSILAIRGSDVLRSDLRTEFEKDSVADQQESYEAAADALSRTIQFLQSEGIDHNLLLPTNAATPALAAFFHLHPDATDRELSRLSRWLWRTWVSPTVRAANQAPLRRRFASAVNPHKLAPELAPTPGKAIDSLMEIVGPVDEILPELTGFRTDKAVSRLVLLALANRGPLDLSGSKIDVAALMDKYGPTAIMQLVESQSGDAAARIFWAPDNPKLTGEEPGIILASHAISEKAARALRTGDIREFLIEREKTLREVVKEFLSTKAVPGAAVRPRLEDLIEEGT